MIDPFRITDYKRNPLQLEELLLFCVSVPGHNAKTTAAALEKFLDSRPPFSTIRLIVDGPPKQRDDESFLNFSIRTVLGFRRLRNAVKASGIGCYSRVTQSFWELAYSGLDLKTCSAAELEAIHGIGKKTSRFFLLSSREGVRCAALDVHILRYLRSLGHAVPSSTPDSVKQYEKIEKVFLQEADRSGKTPAEFDLGIWKAGAER